MGKSFLKMTTLSEVLVFSVSPHKVKNFHVKHSCRIPPDPILNYQCRLLYQFLERYVNYFMIGIKD